MLERNYSYIKYKTNLLLLNFSTKSIAPLLHFLNKFILLFKKYGEEKIR